MLLLLLVLDFILYVSVENPKIEKDDFFSMCLMQLNKKKDLFFFMLFVIIFTRTWMHILVFTVGVSVVGRFAIFMISCFVHHRTKITRVLLLCHKTLIYVFFYYLPHVLLRVSINSV